VLTQVAHDTLALIEIDGGAFVVVITRCDRRNASTSGSSAAVRTSSPIRHAGAGVAVNDRIDVRPRFVNRTVDHVARLVDAVVGRRFPDDLAFDVDLDQARCVISL
jgi:hypothetical protein